MTTTLLSTGLRSLRRTGVVLCVAGVAAFGLAATQPASAAAPRAAGPDAFVQVDHGVAPVFFCDPDQPHAHNQNCIDPDGPRF